MQVALFPEITFPKIKIIADAGQMPVDRMMLTVTRPLELAIKKVPGLKLLRSTTSRGSCELSAFMDWSGDINIDQQRIESKINEAKNLLPSYINIQVEKMNPSILPVSGYTLEGHGHSEVEMKALANYTIKPFLSQVDGVSEIRVIGGKSKEYHLILNQGKMSDFGVTPDAITNAINNTGFIKSNGYLTDYRMMYLSITDAALDDIYELQNLVISNNGKRILLLKDIADIEISEAKEYIRINANGKDAILIAIVKQPDANLIQVSKDMEAKVAELSKTLPKDIKIEPYYLQADFVNDSIRSVADSLLIGLILAIFVAIIFLRSWKASLTILITIPITLLLTLVVLYAFGQTFNIMTLGAMAASIGLIIDDAIVVVEQIHRSHEDHPEIPNREVVAKAIRYLFPAMIGSSLSTIVIFLPFALMTGVAGAYFKVMTNSMIITLICSFFVTWILLPVVYLQISRKGKAKVKSNPKSLSQQAWVKFFLHKPWIAYSLILGFILLIVWIAPKLQTGFLPEMDEGSIVLDYSSPPGTSLDETDHMLKEVEKIIVKQKDVLTYSRRTGTQMGFFITEPNRGDYLIQLKKERHETTEDVINELRTKIEGSQPALRIDFGQVIGDMLGDMMASVQPIEIKIFGNDTKKLKELAIAAADIVEKTQGTADVFNGIVIAGPSVNIQPNEIQLAQFGITPLNFQNQIQTSLEGIVVGNVSEVNQLTDIRMVYPGNNTQRVKDLTDQKLFLTTGKLKSISSFANINLEPGVAEIERENLQSMGVVTARLENRDLGSVMKEIKNKLSTQLPLPQAYNIEYGGSYAQQQQSFKELMMILFLASFLVFAVVLFLFKNIAVSLYVLLISVLGIAGSLLALWLTNIPLNVGSFTGLIMITGIIGENAIFTILQFNETQLEGKSNEESIVYAISTRLRPKLMTALGAIIALMPIALGIGTGAQLHQPLAIAVIGGFVFALPLLLIVLPTLLRTTKLAAI